MPSKLNHTKNSRVFKFGILICLFIKWTPQILVRILLPRQKKRAKFFGKNHQHFGVC